MFAAAFVLSKPNKNPDVKREILFSCHDGERKNDEGFSSNLHIEKEWEREIHRKKRHCTALHCTPREKEKTLIYTRMKCVMKGFVSLQIKRATIANKKIRLAKGKLFESMRCVD